MGDRINFANNVANILKGPDRDISDMETDFPNEKLTDINDNCEEELQNTDSEESAVGKYQNSLKGLCDPAVQTV